MRIVHFDCFAGAAGDMIVGALRDAGVPEEVFAQAIAALHLPEKWSWRFERGSRGGISGWAFRVEAEQETARVGPQAHHHETHHHSALLPAHGRSYAAIRQMLESSCLAETVKSRALGVFRRIAEAEGRIHGVATDEVHFHEVGALDSIVDIVCACAGMESLAPQRVTAGTLVEGTGFVECAHGRFPLPAPATLEILRGIPLAQDTEPGERFTPTGAALLAEFCESFGPMPALRPMATGFGLGTRETPSRPNVLRLIVGEAESCGDATADEVVQIEANLDDCSPELAAAAMEALFAAGALDVWFSPAFMKKNRPGCVLAALAPPSQAEALAQLLLEETTSFGVRMTSCRRAKLARTWREVETPFGHVKIKVGCGPHGFLRAAPEFSSCQEAARRAGVAVAEVFLAAQAAAQGWLANQQAAPPDKSG